MPPEVSGSDAGQLKPGWCRAWPRWLTAQSAPCGSGIQIGSRQRGCAGYFFAYSRSTFDTEQRTAQLRTCSLSSLGELRGLTRLHPHEWHPRLVELCAEAGVAFVVMDTFKGARANGATRWLTPRKALVQLSLRYAWEDIFWFTFFHEAAHVLLHRKKDFFLEGLTPSGDESADQWEDLEREADLFASQMLIPREREAELVTLEIKEIPAFAEELGIAPAIVVGRMQHEQHLPFSQGNELRRRLTFA